MGFEPKIIFEDENVLVLDKPAGLSVHGDGFKKEITLADWLVGRWPSIVSVGEPAIKNGQEILRPGIVHRLDKETSGVMVVAKNETSFKYLKDQFKNRQVQKTYRALVSGVFSKPEVEKIVSLPIGRSDRDPRKRVASLKASGKLRLAETRFKVLATSSEGYTYVEAYPKTGRTHQIRVHLKAIQHPIVGDKLYAGNLTNLPDLNRQALHAYKLILSLPGGAKKEFTAPLPADMALALDKLKLS